MVKHARLVSAVEWSSKTVAMISALHSDETRTVTTDVRKHKSLFVVQTTRRTQEVLTRRTTSYKCTSKKVRD
jgi:hypothetical protein